MPSKILRAVNKLLILIGITLSLYLIFFPLFPELTFLFNKDKNQSYSTLLDASALQNNPNSNILIIPQIGVNTVIIEGEDEEALAKGLWRKPSSSSPDKGGNTVISGHRFLYKSGPKTFYHLDKLNIDDEFLVYWEGKNYEYKVFDIYEVTPDHVEVENNTDEAIITLYTCTPLWNPTKRLIVRANLITTTE